MSEFVGTPVTQLTKKDFSTSGKFTVKHKNQKGKEGLVLFYLDYCSYCQEMKPEYLKLGKLAKSKKFFIGAIDGMENDELFQSQGIAGVPDIRYVSKSGIIDSKKYMGERTASNFLKYIFSKSKGKQSGGAKKRISKRKSDSKKKVLRKSKKVTKKKISRKSKK